MFWELRNPAGNYMFKVGLKYGHWRCSDIFIANFEHISHLVLMFLLLTFEQENAGWVTDTLKRNLYVYIISKIPRKIEKNLFSRNLQTWNSNIYPSVSTMGLTQEANELSKQ